MAKTSCAAAFRNAQVASFTPTKAGGGRTLAAGTKEPHIMQDLDRISMTLSLHDQMLQWTRDADSGAFRLPEELAEPEEHRHCSHCGSPTLEQIEGWLIASLQDELFHPNGRPRL